MRVIVKGRLLEFWKGHSQAQRPLEEWYAVTDKAKWTSFDDLRKTFSSADQVRVRSGRMVTVFNIAGNNYRLVAAIHYNTQKVFILEVMTHDEYSKGTWKRRF